MLRQSCGLQQFAISGRCRLFGVVRFVQQSRGVPVDAHSRFRPVDDQRHFEASHPKLTCQLVAGRVARNVFHTFSLVFSGLPPHPTPFTDPCLQAFFDHVTTRARMFRGSSSMTTSFRRISWSASLLGSDSIRQRNLEITRIFPIFDEVILLGILHY